jgi:small multidrug resistance family-3 protein
MTSLAVYVAAAVVEIAGCFAFWAWLRLGKSVYWILPGIMFLVIFAVLLTRAESIFAGRVFAVL